MAVKAIKPEEYFIEEEPYYETVWVDGPLARAMRNGAICYLDEVVEARKDTTVVIHPLADDRRTLPMEKLGEVIGNIGDRPRLIISLWNLNVVCPLLFTLGNPHLLL